MTISKITNCGLGLNADLSAEELGPGYWSAVENMRFANGYAARFDGTAQIFATPAVVPYFITPYSTVSKKFWVHAGLAAVYVDDGGTRTDITGTTPTGAIDDRWTGGSFNGVLVMNNGADVPMFWGGDIALNLAALTGWDATWRCSSLRPFKNFLIALNVTKGANRYPHMVKWSDSAEAGTVPVSWDETNPALDAGEQNLAETDDLLVDCLPLGDVNIIYKQRSMYAQTLIGAPYIFRFQRLPGSVGLMARGCVVDTPQGHVLLTPNDVVMHNGQGMTSIANAAVKNYIFDNISSTVAKRSFVTFNPAKNEVWVCFPKEGSATCNAACIYNLIDRTWSIRTLANVTYAAVGQVSSSIVTYTWGTSSGAWSSYSPTVWNANDNTKVQTQVLMSHSTPLLSLVDSGNTDFGETIAASMTRSGMHFDAPQAVKTLRSIYPRIDGTLGDKVSIQVGSAMYADQPPVWNTAQNFFIGKAQKLDTFCSGRFLSIKFSNASSNPWRIRSFDVDYVASGLY